MNSDAWKADVEVGDLLRTYEMDRTDVISYPVAEFYITRLNLPVLLPHFFL
jgi:hypothetical protein